jgi:hypothetical protein
MAKIKKSKKNKEIAKKNFDYKVIILYSIILFFVFLFIFIFNKKFGSFSKGDIYYSRLNSWYFCAQKSNWQKADNLESKLDKVDIQSYKSQNNPQDIEKKVIELTNKNNKTVEDWLELTKDQIFLGKKEDAIKSISEARKLDPVRKDIEKLYFSISQ